MKTEELAVLLLNRLKSRGETVSTAESCTGGGIGHALTAVPGSSAAYWGGVISYTNAVKEAVLHVSAETLERVGAVSEETARAMAEGVRHLLGTDYGLSVTGIAGPDGDGSGKSVGLVYIGVSSDASVFVRECHFSGDRAEVRQHAVNTALRELLQLLS